MRHVAATKIQALVRSYFVRRFIMPSVLEAKATEELEKSRIALEETMLGLHQNIHDLAFLEQDQRNAATHIQAWWRGILARRVVGIIVIRHHLDVVRKSMAKGATKIASIIRGRQARMGCSRLRHEKEQRVQQARKQQSDRMMRAVIKIQSHFRRTVALRAMKARRALLVRELDGDATKETQADSGRKPQKGRKRNADQHGGDLGAHDTVTGERRKSTVSSKGAKKAMAAAGDGKAQRTPRKTQLMS